MPYIHGIDVLSASPADFKAYSETVHAQSADIISGKIELEAFIESALDHAERVAVSHRQTPHRAFNGRERHKAFLLRELPVVARKVVAFDKPWWTVEYDDFAGKKHLLLCGVSMSQDARSGQVEMPWCHIHPESI
ncbi:MAG: hypothetical protein ACTHLK_22425 [Brucella intermedia]